MADSRKFPYIAVCAPCYNEADSIRTVVQGWLDVLNTMAKPFEIIIVDDGSDDGTLELLSYIYEIEPRVLVLRFDENQGYGMAISAAVEASRAQWVVTIDSDGQFSLEDLPAMVRLAEERNLQLVSGVRKKNDPRMSAKAGDWLIRAYTRFVMGSHIKDTQCALKLWDGELVRSIVSSFEPRGFLTPTLWSLVAERMGAKVANMPVRHFPRNSGSSKIDPLRDGTNMLKELMQLKRIIKSGTENL